MTQPSQTDGPDPLIEEASRKAAVAWLAAGDAPAVAAWCLPQGGALYVVTGPGEQSLPGVAEAPEVAVTLRGDHGGAVVRYPATVTRVEPGTDAWDEVVPALAGKRLNAGGDSTALAERWARECAVLRLVPAGAAAALGDGAQAAVPRPTSAAPAVRRPFRLHRVRRR